MDNSITLMIKHHVQSTAVPAYESWLKEITKASQEFPGHCGVAIIRPHGAGVPYSILLRFDTHEHLMDWVGSPTRKTLIDQAQQWLEAIEETEIETGLEYWFTPPEAAPLHAKPYKQFLVTLSAIYPLTQILPWLLSPILAAEPVKSWPHVASFGIVVLIVFLMVYVIMPRYTRLVAGWLFR